MVKSSPGETFHEAGAALRPKARVLFVDDDEVIAASVAQTLRAAGYEVRTAVSFQVALDVLDGPDPLDLLITDLVMPRQVNGIALSRMARLRRAGLKIIYITGFDIPDIAETQAVGPILRKPFSDEALLEQVEQVLGAP